MSAAPKADPARIDLLASAPPAVSAQVALPSDCSRSDIFHASSRRTFHIWTFRGPEVFGEGSLTWHPERNLGALVAEDPRDEMIIDGATGNRTLLSEAGPARGPALRDPMAAAWEQPWNRIMVGDDSLDGLMVIDAVSGQRVIVSR